MSRESANHRLPSLRDASGYTLVALLAVMTLLALFASAAAISVRQQVQREREKEAIFRGEQVAEAIRAYYHYRSSQGVHLDAALPTSVDQLLEGIPVGSKKRQILRASAARDPLSSSGEWRLITPRSPGLVEFQRSVMVYAGNVLPPSVDKEIVDLQGFAVPQIAAIINPGEAEPAPGEDDFSAASSGPFVGVASQSRNKSVLYYYGIGRYDQWVFTPLFRQP